VSLEERLSIFDMVLNRKTVRGSVVGTKIDLIECFAFAASKKVSANYTLERLQNINTIFEKMRHGEIKGHKILHC
jgi:propanol-preferring alcohol dehydrogenase